jgi:hypothetical protein
LIYISRIYSTHKKASYRETSAGASKNAANKRIFEQKSKYFPQNLANHPSFFIFIHRLSHLSSQTPRHANIILFILSASPTKPNPSPIRQNTSLFVRNRLFSGRSEKKRTRLILHFSLPSTLHTPVPAPFCSLRRRFSFRAEWIWLDSGSGGNKG